MRNHFLVSLATLALACGAGSSPRDAAPADLSPQLAVDAPPAPADVTTEPDTAVPIVLDAAAAPDLAAPADLAGPADRPPPPAGNPFVYVGSVLASEIRIFELEMTTGALMPRGSAPSGPSPDYMAFHPSGRYLYALNEVADGRVVAFSINAATGMLTRIGEASSGGNGPAHISMHRSGKWLLSSNYVSGHVAALPIMADGTLGPPVAPRVAGTFAHMILDDGASGGFVFVPSKGDDRVLQYRFDELTGRLTPNMPAFVAQGGAPRHMAFDRSGRFAYLLTEAGHTLVSFRYDPATGLLGDGAPVEAAPSGDGSHVVLHPHRPFLYASVRSYDTIALFTIDAAGRATSPRQFRDQIARPWDMSIDPTGKFLLVANNDNATVKVLRIDDQTGALTVASTTTVAPQPRFVGILPRPTAP
jgi:6-phosphogluconolactonase